MLPTLPARNPFGTGALTTRGDPHGGETIYDLLPEELHGLTYVGRLDRDATGGHDQQHDKKNGPPVHAEQCTGEPVAYRLDPAQTMPAFGSSRRG